jgi:pimeloyl-ACP methyl ester carboxylesterase
MEWLVTTPDGRTLAVEDAGDPDGRPVMVHVGTPNSRHLYGRTVADATARGLRLISYDRPVTARPSGLLASSAVPSNSMTWSTADAASCSATITG